ncbi:hypothetical protein CU098_006302, partial [Rhizopus stolonifer]
MATLKDRQEAMNKVHPFGLPLWKPALYKKSRSIVRKANNALHSSPSSTPELFLNPGNVLWLLLFGWWLSLVTLLLSIITFIFNGRPYSLLLKELSLYLLWPFGKYVERQAEITSTQLDHVSSEEMTGLLSFTKKEQRQSNNLKNIYDLGLRGCVYYALFLLVLAPLLSLVSIICWMAVVSVPMAKLNYILVCHLYQNPLSLRFKSAHSRLSEHSHTTEPYIILLCNYQAIGFQYYKYTLDGINIMFINLIPLVFFVILDDYVLKHHFKESFITASVTIFSLSLVSVIPLSYFIGMSVSSISAQSSMGVGAVINATFGKGVLVEGALIGSLLAGVLLMPGFSMISGGVK